MITKTTNPASLNHESSSDVTEDSAKVKATNGKAKATKSKAKAKASKRVTKANGSRRPNRYGLGANGSKIRVLKPKALTRKQVKTGQTIDQAVAAMGKAELHGRIRFLRKAVEAGTISVS